MRSAVDEVLVRGGVAGALDPDVAERLFDAREVAAGQHDLRAAEILRAAKAEDKRCPGG